MNQVGQVTRWMQITEEESKNKKFYAFAHPLLAKTFAEQLEDEAEDALQKLIDYCAKWSEHHSAYALRHYAEHLRDVKRWEELYLLARNEDFASAQRQQLPDEPDLPLKTVQTALLGAAEEDNPEIMAEFLLVHARRLMQIAQQSPLKILRLGNINGALALVETFDPASCILWYLILAWELATDANQDRGKIEQAREILKRLQRKDLPRLSNSWMQDWAVYLLIALLPVANGTFTELSKRILDDVTLVNLCQNLVEGSDFTTALDTARQIDNSSSRARALTEIAKAQPTATNFAAALDTARQIDDSYNRARALTEIAKAQATAENFAAALDTARQIDDSSDRAQALTEIALAQPTAENFAAALDTARQIDDSSDRAQALTEIAKAQATAENFAAALDTARQIDDSSSRAQALTEIAKAQVKAKLSEQALLTAAKILIDHNLHLPKLAAAFVETADEENH